MNNTVSPARPAPELMKETVHLSFGEEVGNAISHGVLMLLFLFGLPFLSVYGYQKDGWTGCIGIAIYTICMILMFGGSCLYHIMPYNTTWKLVFRKLDHISILLAIAGTYTPICLSVIKGWAGWTILAVEWALVVGGVLLKSISRYAHPKLSLALYLAMGWMAVFILPQAWKQCGLNFILLLLAGGLCYTIGVIFYVRKKPYDHFIWHLFIAAAALIFLAAIVIYL